MKREKFKKYGQEIMLMVLRTTSKKIEELEKIGDISGREILEKDVITPYEKIYKSLSDMEIDNYTDEEFEYLKKTLEDIREKNSLAVAEVNKNLELREKNRGKSGSEVVERFFKYELNRALDRKDEIQKRYEKLLERENILQLELGNAIQEEEQFEIIYSLHPIKKEMRELEEKYLEMEKNIKNIKNKIDSKWYYEIYGIISEEELLKTYKNIYNIK